MPPPRRRRTTSRSPCCSISTAPTAAHLRICSTSTDVSSPAAWIGTDAPLTTLGIDADAAFFSRVVPIARQVSAGWAVDVSNCIKAGCYLVSDDGAARTKSDFSLHSDVWNTWDQTAFDNMVKIKLNS